MAKLTSAHSERAGVHAVGLIFHTKLGWYFREQKETDFTVDAEVEITENGTPNRKLLALQIKSGHLSSGDAAPTRLLRLDQTYRLLAGHCLPVFIILHNPENGVTLWQQTQRHLIKLDDKGWSITVPASNALIKEAKNSFLSVSLTIIHRSSAIDLRPTRQI